MSETWGVEDKEYFRKCGIRVQERAASRSPKLDWPEILKRFLRMLSAFAFMSACWWAAIYYGLRFWKP